jgi:hypothetical protein
MILSGMRASFPLGLITLVAYTHREVDANAGSATPTGEAVAVDLAAAPSDSALLSVMKEGRIGFINRQGEIIIQPQFENAREFSDGMAAISVNEKWGFIDFTGQVKIEPKHDDVGKFSESYSWVAIGEKRGYINQTGRLVVPLVLENFIEHWDVGEADFSEGISVSACPVA